ncbi:unnamed protein product, partial [Tilletia laevis]
PAAQGRKEYIATATIRPALESARTDAAGTLAFDRLERPPVPVPVPLPPRLLLGEWLWACSSSPTAGAGAAAGPRPPFAPS